MFRSTSEASSPVALPSALSRPLHLLTCHQHPLQNGLPLCQTHSTTNWLTLPVKRKESTYIAYIGIIHRLVGRGRAWLTMCLPPPPVFIGRHDVVWPVRRGTLLATPAHSSLFDDRCTRGDDLWLCVILKRVHRWQFCVRNCAALEGNRTNGFT